MGNVAGDADLVARAVTHPEGCYLCRTRPYARCLYCSVPVCHPHLGPASHRCTALDTDGQQRSRRSTGRREVRPPSLGSPRSVPVPPPRPVPRTGLGSSSPGRRLRSTSRSALSDDRRTRARTSSSPAPTSEGEEDEPDSDPDVWGTASPVSVVPRPIARAARANRSFLVNFAGRFVRLPRLPRQHQAAPSDSGPNSEDPPPESESTDTGPSALHYTPEGEVALFAPLGSSIFPESVPQRSSSSSVAPTTAGSSPPRTGTDDARYQ